MHTLYCDKIKDDEARLQAHLKVEKEKSSFLIDFERQWHDGEGP